MKDRHLSVWVRWLLIAGIILFILKVIIDLVEHPLVVTTAGESGILFSILIALAVLTYAWFAVFQTRISSPAELDSISFGAGWGLVCGAAWSVELAAANLPSIQSWALNHTLYFASALAGFALPGLAGLLAGRSTGKLGLGLRAGLLCGMAGGLIIFLTEVVFSDAFNLFQDPQTIAEFQRSGLPDLATYIVGDTLALLIDHLYIGIITGAVLGLVGAAVGKAARKL